LKITSSVTPRIEESHLTVYPWHLRQRAELSLPHIAGSCKFAVLNRANLLDQLVADALLLIRG